MVKDWVTVPIVLELIWFSASPSLCVYQEFNILYVLNNTLEQLAKQHY